MASDRSQTLPSKLFSHPIWLVSLALLVVNDHLLKGAGILPGWFTGKLSDFAGLIVAPALLAWLLRARSQRQWLLAHVAVGVGFALLEWAPAARAAEAMTDLVGLHWRLTADVTDLLALVSLGVSWHLVNARPAARSLRRGPTRGEVALGCFGLLASVATSKAHEPIVPMTPADARRNHVEKGEMGLPFGASSPSVIRDGEVFVDGLAVIANPRTGKTRSLSFEAREGLGAAPPVAATDAAWLFTAGSTSDPMFVALDARTGEELWDEDAETYEMPVAATGVFVFAERSEIVARSAREGDEVWSHEQTSPVFRLASDGARIFVLAADDKITVLDAATGNVEKVLSAVGHSTTYRIDRSSLAVTDGMVAVLAPGGLQVAHHTGDDRWSESAEISAPKPSEHWASPGPGVEVFGTQGVIVLFDAGNTVRGFDATTGKILWTKAASATKSVRVADGYVALTETRTAILDARTGQTLSVLDGSGRLELFDEGAPVQMNKAR